MEEELAPIYDREINEEVGVARKRRFDELSEHSTVGEGLAAMQQRGGLDYRFSHNQGSLQRTSVYRCVSHRSCLKYIRMVRLSREDGTEYISLEESGIHGAVATRDGDEEESLEEGDGTGGIAPILKNETDAILMGGAGPMKCYLLLKKKHAGSEKMLSMLPSLLQLKNRKAYLKKRLGGHFEIVTLAALMDWVSKKICDGCCQFYGRPEGPVYTENDTRVTSFGIIFTSRRIFLNVKTAINGQGDSIFGASDGTYKLHFGGWTLINSGTYSTEYSRGKFSKHFVPWSLMFVRTEHEAAYQELFAATRDMSQSLFGIDLKLRFGSLDHTAAIANAYRAVWPDIVLLNCWPHLVRKSKEKVALLTRAEYYEDVVYPHLVWMHQSRTPAQFAAIGELCLQKWGDDGEEAYTAWFREVYFSAPWDTWYVGSAGDVSGILPNQNPLESFHRKIKQVAVESLRASTATVLNSTLPNILSLACEVLDGCPTHVRHYAEGPIPAELFVRARVLISYKTNFLRMCVPGSKIIRAIVFNADGYINSPTDAHSGVSVTVARVKRYTNSLKGDLIANKTVADVPLLYMSLHTVDIIDDSHAALSNHPKWTHDEIEVIRNGYRCDCTTRRQSGWICEHVLATMALVTKIDLDSALSTIPVRRTPGGPRKSRGALTRYVKDEHFFSEKNLTRLLAKSPAHCLHWSVLKQFDYVDDGKAVKEYLAGRVTGWQENKGRYVWSLRFAHETDLVTMQCEELAHALSSLLSLLSFSFSNPTPFA